MQKYFVFPLFIGLFLSGCANSPPLNPNLNSRAPASNSFDNLTVYRIPIASKASNIPILKTNISGSEIKSLQFDGVYSNSEIRKKYFYNGCYRFDIKSSPNTGSKTSSTMLCYESNKDRFVEYSKIFSDQR